MQRRSKNVARWQVAQQGGSHATSTGDFGERRANEQAACALFVDTVIKHLRVDYSSEASSFRLSRHLQVTTSLF